MATAFIGLEQANIITPEIADEMRRSVGYRNVSVHSYDEINLAITYAIAQKHLSDFKQFIQQILVAMENLA